jgi:alkanesulfonate monooxygenase SsuD/methylene tetrahydromethanopterin reductase-like flavin-dependent oxidoreductase (luciferase family)
MFECWTTMAAISQRTSRVRLGQMVGCAPYRNPGLLAKITSTIDVMSGGRLDWGIGAGWYDHEFRGYGYEFHKPSVRIKVLEETVEIVKAMWSEPDVSYAGTHFRLDGAQCDPKPLQQPHPPIWIGGTGPKRTLPLAARYADVWHAYGTPGSLAEANARIDELATAAGRDPSAVLRAGSLSLDDLDTARKHAAKWRDAGYGYLVCGWPAAGAPQVERFVRDVVPDLT